MSTTAPEVGKAPPKKAPPKKDPPMRKDHTCHVCRNPLPEMAIKHGDPFCRPGCARDFYEISVRSGPLTS